MQPTVFQKAELRDENDNIVQQGTYGKGSALSNSTNDGWIDYVMNNLEALYGIAKDEVVPVSALPASGDMNKTYLLTTTGVCYRWDGTEWVEISSSEAVGRAEAAADLAEEWATKTGGAVADNEYSAKYYSNVSKDWANKLNAMVDGSEYSAKHYAGVAEGWAEDAEDTAEDIADHLAQIDENTTDIGIADKRISNIEKLLQGNLYDYQTDFTSAYTKTVPSGALPYAGLEKVGGRTIVANNVQVALQAGFITNFLQAYGVTVTTHTNSDGSVTYTFDGTYTGSDTYSLMYYTFTGGHKYVLKGCPPNGSATTYYYGIGGVANDIGEGYYYAPAGNASTSIRFYTKNGSVFDNAKVCLQCIDLTLMFGAGNEPASVAEYNAIIQADMPMGMPSKLLSAGVTEVVSQSKNLANYSDGLGYPSDITYSNATKRKFTIGKYVKDLSFNNYYNDSRISNLSVTQNSISFQTSLSEYGVGIPFNCKGGTKYTISVTLPTNGYFIVLWYYSDGTFAYTEAAGVSSPKTYTSPAGAKQGVMLMYTGTTGTVLTFSNIQVEEAESATTYSAPFKIATPIPASVQALEGYGWSAGTAYNYIDFERKVFIKRVGAVDLGTLTWVSASSCFYAAMPSDSKTIVQAGIKNILCSRFIRYQTSSIVELASVEKVMSVNNANFNSNKSVFIHDSSYPDAATFKTAMSGVYLYYELDTPVEVDISEYLTDDNLIQVEAGGMLTFENQHGDDYRLPVPSEEEYMIDLQEAINNG